MKTSIWRNLLSTFQVSCGLCETLLSSWLIRRVIQSLRRSISIKLSKSRKESLMQSRKRIVSDDTWNLSSKIVTVAPWCDHWLRKRNYSSLRPLKWTSWGKSLSNRCLSCEVRYYTESNLRSSMVSDWQDPCWHTCRKSMWQQSMMEQFQTSRMHGLTSVRLNVRSHLTMLLKCSKISLDRYKFLLRNMNCMKISNMLRKLH